MAAARLRSSLLIADDHRLGAVVATAVAVWAGPGAVETACRTCPWHRHRQPRARLPLRGANDELDQVASAFNEALARLERSVSDMRQFSAALAHELRTPLAVLRGEVELALRSRLPTRTARALASQIDEFDRLTRLIDQILTLARAGGGEIRLNRAPVRLSEIASMVGEQVELLADARKLH